MLNKKMLYICVSNDTQGVYSVGQRLISLLSYQLI